MTFYLVFDIETIELPIPQEAIEEAIAEAKEEVEQEKAIAKRVARFSERWKFSMEGAKPIAIAAECWSPDLEIQPRLPTWSLATDDTKSLIVGFLGLIQDCKYIIGEENKLKLCGFNITGFDLPILLTWMIKLGISNTSIFDRYSIVDLMYEPLGKTLGRKSLNYYARIFNLTKREHNGSEVAQMWDLDRLDGGRRVQDYCKKDVEVEIELLKAFSRLYRL